MGCQVVICWRSDADEQVEMTTKVIRNGNGTVGQGVGLRFALEFRDGRRDCVWDVRIWDMGYG